MTWLYKGEPFDIPEDTDPKTYPHYSFVYVITNNLTGKKYVGKKVLWSQITRPPLKGQTRKRKVIKSSDWRKYYGSCKPLLADIEKYGKDNFTREIIGLHPDKREANYHELCFQIYANVLGEVDANGERVWYNENIDRVYYNSEKYSDRRKEMHDQLNRQFAPKDQSCGSES